MRSDEEVVCWGLNEDGELGIGNTLNVGDDPNEMGDNLVPVNLGTGYSTILSCLCYKYDRPCPTCAGVKVSKISCNGRHSCVLRTDERIACWGWNGNGELGIGSTNNIGTSSASMGNNMLLVDLGSGIPAAFHWNSACSI